MDFFSYKIPVKNKQELDSEIKLEIETEIISIAEEPVAEELLDDDPDVRFWARYIYQLANGDVVAELCAQTICNNHEKKFIQFLVNNHITHLDLSGAVISKDLITHIANKCRSLIEINVKHTQFNATSLDAIEASSILYVYAENTCLNQADKDQLESILNAKLITYIEAQEPLPRPRVSL